MHHIDNYFYTPNENSMPLGESLKVLDIKLVNTITDSNMKKLKDITVEDLLARHPKDLDKKQILTTGQFCCITFIG